MHRAVALALVSLVLAARPAFAQPIDQPISGAKLLLKQSSSGKQKLTFTSKDPSFPFPVSEGPEDPLTFGATIEVITPGAPTGGPFAAPPNSTQPGWTHKDGPNPSYRYKRDKAYAATTSIKAIVIKNARGVTVQGEATGIPLDGARGSVSIRITIGGHRSCARFDGAAVTKDAVGQFQGKNASAPAIPDCGVATLKGEPAVCGDGDADPQTEQCDGAWCAVPGYEGEGCRLPGSTGECSCCSDGSRYLPCCNPSSLTILYPPLSKVCVPSGCTPPYECRSGDECRPDESCCSTNNANLCMQAYAPPFAYTMITLIPCCAGLECRRFAMPQGATCCASGGTACTGDGDCCTGHCQIDGTCEACRAGGAACGIATECCSGSCTGSICDACAPAGTFCTSSATCCSGMCIDFHCRP